MPMTTCPTCQAEVSTEAAACPKCGHAFRPTGGGINMSGPVHVIRVIIAIIILVGFVAFGVRNCYN